MDLLLNILSIVIGFVVVIISIPSIVNIAKAKNLFEPLEERKIHTTKIPPLGGIAIFSGFTLSTLILSNNIGFSNLKYILASTMIMFFIGLKDDLIVISAKKKFVVQIFSAVLLITMGGIQITNLHGLFGIYELHYLNGVLISLFIMLAVINAFNLIDGIDGLASGLGIVATLAFGLWFYLSGHTQFAIMSFALLGSLVGFYIYNVFGKKNKLFMGDTGSLVMGLIISVLAIQFNEFNIIKTTAFSINSAPSVSFAIIIVPLVDTLRVIAIRILQGRSPFSPDKNHIHHRLLEIVPSHFKVSMSIVVANIFFIGIAFLTNYYAFNINLQIVLIFSLATFISFVPGQIIQWHSTKSKHRFGFAHQL